MLVMIILVRWFLATNAGLTRNWLENGCIDQPSALVWAVFGLSNAGQTSIWMVTWGYAFPDIPEPYRDYYTV